MFRDVRKFGKVFLLAVGEFSPRLQRIGVDALHADAAELWPVVRRRPTAIKNLLLDQSLFAGVGNIYADEALFHAGVRPRRAAIRLSRPEFVRLVDAVRAVLQRAIDRGGSSISDYVAPDGTDGTYQHERKVYARENEPCSVCATPIRRVVIGQRSAHFCPSCQR
jgi:formamidopyrimidine-DNA glycosylase